MEFCILTEDEFRNFSKSCPYESFMQTVELAHLKEELGSKIHYVGVKKDDNIIASSLMLEDTTILGKKMFYAPRGLLVDYHNKELLTFFTKNLKKYIKKQGGFILTIDPNVIYRVRTSDGEIDKNNPSDNESIQNLKDLGYKHYGFNIYLDSRQARWCYRFTLDQDYESKKVKFSKSTRKNIDFCIKKGLMVREGTIDDLKVMAEIFEVTSKRRDFFSRSLDYYQKMYKQSSVLLLRKCLLCHLRTLHSGTSHRVMPEADGSDARSRVHCMQEFSSLHRILFQPPVPYLLPYMIWIHPLTPLQLFHMLLLHLP